MTTPASSNTHKPAVIWLQNGPTEPQWLAQLKSLVRLQDDPAQADYIVVVGGDGAMLHSIHQYRHHHKPFIGLHAGTRGFLMNDFADGCPLPDSFATIHLQTLWLLEAELTTDQGTQVLHAFNDIWVERSKGQVLKMFVDVDTIRQPPLIVGDGLLFATPQGSTGYNCALGGKVILPSVSTLQMTPMSCVINKTPLGSVLLPATAKVKVTLQETHKRPARCFYDGIEYTGTDSILQLSVQRSQQTVQLGFFAEPIFSNKVFAWQFQF